MARFCTACGARLEETAKFCTGCGAACGDAASLPLQRPAAQPYPQSPPAPSFYPIPPGRRKKVPVVFIVISVFVLVPLAGLFFLISKIVGTANQVASDLDSAFADGTTGKASVSLSEGERYFAGSVDFEHADSCMVDFILCADGKSVRNVKVLIRSLHLKGQYEGRNLERTVGQVLLVLGSGELDAQGCVELESNSAVLRLTIDGSAAGGEMDYYYSNEPDPPYIRFFIGTYPFEAKEVPGQA